MAARTFRKTIQQQSRAFYGVIFYVYTNVDNRKLYFSGGIVRQSFHKKVMCN